VIDAIVEMVIALIFIWGTTWCAIMSLRFGKLLSVYGSFVKLALLAVFLLLTIVFVFGGHATGQHLGVADLVPHDWGLIVSAILPVLIFNWVGFELQNGAGEEMENPQRDVPRSVIRAGLTAVLAYGLVIAVILFALTKDQLSQATGFLSAFKVVSSVLPAPVATGLGLIVALGVVIALASSGGTWIIGADRTYAIAALDRNAPKLLGRFSGRYGTPIAVNTMSGIVATLAMFVAIIVNAFGTGSIAVLFQLVLGFVISTTTLSYLFIFPSYLILRYKYPDIRRPYKVPGGMTGAWIVTLLPLTYAAIATYFILWPTDANVSSVGRLAYELTQFVPLGIIALLTIVFYIWGQNQASNRDVAVELNLADMNESELSAGAGE
jgi:amino acid transporter